MIVKLVNNEKEYFKCTSKSGYKSHKIFDNNFVAMHKSKLALTIFRMGDGRGTKRPPTSFSPVTSTNVGISP